MNSENNSYKDAWEFTIAEEDVKVITKPKFINAGGCLRIMGIDVFSPPYNGNEEQALQATKKLMLDNFSTVSFLNDWSVLRGAENSGEELLEKHGVKGIKYKAQRGVGARNVPETGADNYVIFDDKLISIMKKYGIVGPVAVSAMASQEQEEA